MLPKHYLKWKILLKPEQRKVDGRNPSGEVGRRRLGLRDDAVDTGQLGSSWILKEPYGGPAHGMFHEAGTFAAPEHTGCLINSCSVSGRIDGSQFIK